MDWLFADWTPAGAFLITTVQARLDFLIHRQVVS
jgi:hypothetical protein